MKLRDVTLFDITIGDANRRTDKYVGWNIDVDFYQEKWVSRENL